MQIVAAVFVVLGISLSAQAGPRLGDMASYSGSYQGVPYSQRLDVVSYDAKKQLYQVDATTTTAQDVQTLTEWHPMSEMYDRDQLHMLVERCVEAGGVPEQVQTAAGLFDSCLITDAQGQSINYAEVPFQYVRFATNGWKADLVQYFWGN